MGGIPAPSRYILQKAWKLGQKMAYRERRLRPDVAGAHQYANFALFRTVHRHRLEDHAAFVPWEEKLAALIEREASGQGFPLDDSSQWERFEKFIATPIRSSFWYGWELVQDLERLYREEAEQARAHARKKQVIHVYRPPTPPVVVPTALPEGDEVTLWDAAADKLFVEMNGDSDEGIWNMPGADNPFGITKSSEPSADTRQTNPGPTQRVVA